MCFATLGRRDRRSRSYNRTTLEELPNRRPQHDADDGGERGDVLRSDIAKREASKISP